MKKINYLLGWLLFLAMAIVAQAQVTLPQSGEAPLQTACTGTILDSGGTEDYQDGVNSSVTISPNAQNVSVSFSEFALESCCDRVRLYDGATTAAPLIAELGMELPGDNVYSSTGSSMTVQFTTDGSVTQAGFVLNWEVEGAELDATFLPSDANPPANIPVLFMATAGCAEFAWDFGDGATSTESDPTHTYTAPGTYTVSLVVTSDLGEQDTYSSQIVVQDFGDISATPGAFSGTLPYQGDSIVAPLTITNNGDGPLEYSIEGGALQSDKGLNLLSLTNFSTTDYPKVLTAINTYFDDYILEEAAPANVTELNDLLAGADIVLLPETEDCNVSLFAAFGPALNAFAEQGGTIIVIGANEGDCIFATNLFDGTHEAGAGGTTTSALNISLPEDPLLQGIIAPYAVQVNTFVYNLTNDDAVRVLESADAKDVMAYRNIGDGRAIFIGHDYKFSNANMKRLVSNAVKTSQGGGSWLYLSQLSGTLAPGESVTIDVELNANYVCGGLYEQDLTIYSNDPDQPQITIPCSLDIQGTPSYSASATSFDFGELQQFDTNTQQLIINNPGNYELNVSITSSNAGFVVEPSTFTVPGCDGSITVAVTFAPLEVQTYTGTLTVQTNAAPFPFTIPLTGSSVGAPITSITPNPIEVSVMTGETTTQDITISNTGIGPLTYNIDTANFDPIIDIVIFNNPNTDANAITNINANLAANFSGQYEATNTAASSPTQLSAALENADIFIVPSVFDAATAATFATFGSVLQNFVAEGGTVLFFGTMAWNGSVYQAPATESGLFPGALLAFNSGDLISLSDPNHPLVDDLEGSFESSGFYALQLPDTFDGISLLDQTEFPGNPGSGGSILASRDIGQGRAIFFGSNGFGFASDDDELVFRNIIQWTKTTRLAEWLDLNGVVTDGYIPSNQTGILTATFDSGNLLGGVYTTEIEVVTNDPVQPTITIPVIMTVIGVPQISVDVLSLDYGALVIGDNDGQSITISNPGTDNLIINSISTSDPAFTTSASSLTIPPFGSANLTVTFAPAAIQNYNSTLNLDNNATDLTIALTGQGQGAPISSVSPDQISVSLEEGQTSSQSVTLSNGAAAAGNFSWVVNGDGAPQVLLMKYGTDEFLFNNLLGYLATYAPTAVNTEFNSSDPQALANALEGKDLLIIPQQTGTTSVTAAMTTFAPILAEYTNNGGTVLFTGNTCSACISNTGLLAGTYFTGLFGGNPMTILNSNHPLTAGIPDAYIPFFNVTTWQFSNTDFVTLATDPTGQGSAIGYRPAGAGKVLFWGFDFNTMNDVVMGASLGTTVSYGAGELPDWLSITPFSGTTPSGQNSTITVNFDSEGLATGVYQYTIIIYTNDPLNPVYTVPCTMNVIALPEAAFSADQTFACGTGTIQFSDETANVATSWSWDFGDGTTSTEQNPIHTYAANGSYTVTLESCNDLGCSTEVVNNYIVIDLDCQSIVFPTSGTHSTGQCYGLIQDDGGDGNYTNGVETTYTIAPTGAINVVLTFTAFQVETCCDYLRIYDGPDSSSPLIGQYTSNPGTITSTSDAITLNWHTDGSVAYTGFEASWQCTIVSEPPTPDFGYEVVTECLGQIQFTDESFNFPDTYTWDFGDGTTSDEENPEHFYAASGTYNVTLNACNLIGCEEVTIPVTIENVLFVDINIPECTNVNTPVLLDDNTIGAVDWTWTFGNGNGAQGLASPITFYSTPGTYTITLTVTNANGCERTITQDILIVPAGQPCPVSVQNPNLEAGVSVSPNPTTGLFSIDYAFDGVQNIGYRVFDAIGREVASNQAIRATSSYHTDIDLTAQPAGMYFVVLQTSEGAITKRIMVE